MYSKSFYLWVPLSVMRFSQLSLMEFENMSSVFRCVMGVIFNQIVVLTAPWVVVRRTSQCLCTLVITKEEIRRVYLLLFQIRNTATTQNQCVDSPVGEEHHNKAVIPYPCHRQGGNQVQKMSNRAFIQTDI